MPAGSIPFFLIQFIHLKLVKFSALRIYLGKETSDDQLNFNYIIARCEQSNQVTARGSKVYKDMVVSDKSKNVKTPKKDYILVRVKDYESGIIASYYKVSNNQMANLNLLIQNLNRFLANHLVKNNIPSAYVVRFKRNITKDSRRLHVQAIMPKNNPNPLARTDSDTVTYEVQDSTLADSCCQFPPEGEGASLKPDAF